MATRYALTFIAIGANGCVTAATIGAQGVGSRAGGSVEATFGYGVGLGGEDVRETHVVEVAGAIGGGDHGAQGRVLAGYEFQRTFDRFGWQLGFASGGSFGGYQNADFVLQLSGGPHVVVRRGRRCATTIALDATVGYALQTASDALLHPDGALVGIAVSLHHLTFRTWGPN